MYVLCQPLLSGVNLNVLMASFDLFHSTLMQHISRINKNSLLYKYSVIFTKSSKNWSLHTIVRHRTDGTDLYMFGDSVCACARSFVSLRCIVCTCHNGIECRPSSPTTRAALKD